MAKVIDIPPVVTLDKEFKFSEFLGMALDMYEPCGKGLKQIRQAVKIHAILENLNGDKSIRLEDADYEVVKASVDSAKWAPRAARVMVTYFEAVENAQDLKA